MGEQGKVNGGHICVGIHTNGSGIDDDGGITMVEKIIIVIFAGAGDDDHIRFVHLQHGLHHFGCAAAAKYQAFLSGGVDSALRQHGVETKMVCIVPNQPAVAADDGIHCAQIFRDGGQLVQVVDDGLLVGDGDVDAVPISVVEKIFQFVWLFLVECVFVIAQVGVDGRGVAVG